MMKRLILGITLSISMAASHGFADGVLAPAKSQLQLMYSALETSTLEHAEHTFTQQMKSVAGVTVTPGMLASFTSLHKQIYSTKSVTLDEVKSAIGKYGIEDFKGVQSALKSVGKNPFNEANLGSSSYVAGLSQGRQGVPAPRASISGSQKGEAALVQIGRDYKASPEFSDAFSKAVSGDTNEARDNAAAAGEVIQSLSTACSGIEDKSCPAKAKRNAERYLALHVFPNSKTYGARSLSLLQKGINQDGLQSEKTGIPKMSLHNGLDHILDKPGQLSDEKSHLGTCGLGRAPELKSYAAAI